VLVFLHLSQLVFLKRGFQIVHLVVVASLSWFIHISTEVILSLDLGCALLPFLFWVILNGFIIWWKPGNGDLCRYVQLFYGLFLLNLFGSVFADTLEQFVSVAGNLVSS
jgi:hypothetical protein